ncbi:MAG TPA: hypothetical protein PLF78_07075 [Caulobacter sp.]|nr:hypothetical protein [Caulobacter sp.]
MSFRRCSGLAAIAALLAVAAPSQARAPIWIPQSSNGNPVAAIGVGGGASIQVFCYARPSPRYVLVAKGPARGLRPGRGVIGRIQGRQTVKVRFDRIELAPGSLAVLTVQGGLRGTTGDQPRALYSIEAIRAAKKPITLSSGPFSITVPETGAAAAIARLEKTCGDVKGMAKRAEGRFGEVN